MAKLGPATDTESSSHPVQYGKLLRWGWRIISWGRFWFVSSVVLTFLAQVATLVSVKVIEKTLTLLQGKEVQGQEVQGLIEYFLPKTKIDAAIAFAVVGVLILLLRFLSRAASLYSDNVLTRRLQLSLHDKLLTLGPEYHQKHQQGELTSVVMNFATGAQGMLTGIYATPFIRGMGLIIAVIFLMDSLSKAGGIPVGLQLALLVAMLAFPIMGWLLAQRLKKAYVIVRERQIALTNELVNSISNPVEVQVMAAQPQRSRAFGQRLREYFSSQFRAALRGQVASQFQDSIVLILQVLFVSCGVYYAVQDPANSSKLVASIVGFLLLIPSVVAPLREIVTFLTGLQRSWPLVEVVINTLEARPAVEDRPNASELSLAEAPSIELRRVDFSYEPDLPNILDGVSYTFPPGSVTAIVARSGMGKSTVLNLLCRLRDPQKGEVLIDGRDVREFQLFSVRRGLAKASQFPLFIVDTIRANFHLAKPDAPDTEIQAVCEQTGLWDILRKAAPTGPLDYVLPRNEGLSGGERRLLNVTRSLIHRPRVLLFDEPTTGVDASGRQDLIRCLRLACRGMTVLLVDHDMNFVRDWADQICVLEDGRFVEEGTPQELLARTGSAFRRLWEDHNKSEADGPDTEDTDASPQT